MNVKLSVEQISDEKAEEVIVCCHNPEERWEEAIRAVTAGELTITGVTGEKLYRVKIGEVYYFEIVEGRSFLYCQKQVFECRLKLYEFEALCRGTLLFRCSKSMILNADKIEYVRPSVSGRFEATLYNQEKVVISRQYVSELKRLLEI